jgi:arylsulfatase A-like enzyme
MNPKTWLQELQTAVSEVMEALEETDQYSNTIIVFLSDNGGRRVDTDKPEQGRISLTFIAKMF